MTEPEQPVVAVPLRAAPCQFVFALTGAACGVPDYADVHRVGSHDASYDRPVHDYLWVDRRKRDRRAALAVEAVRPEPYQPTTGGIDAEPDYDHPDNFPADKLGQIIEEATASNPEWARGARFAREWMRGVPTEAPARDEPGIDPELLAIEIEAFAVQAGYEGEEYLAGKRYGLQLAAATVRRATPLAERPE